LCAVARRKAAAGRCGDGSIFRGVETPKAAICYCANHLQQLKSSLCKAGQGSPVGTRTQRPGSEPEISGCFARLLEERSRLNLTQQQVAEIAGVSTKTVRRWEQSIAIPIDAVAALVLEGFDAQYISCGVRSANLRDVRSWVREDGGLYAVPPASTPDEIEMLASYRKLDTTQRSQARAVLAALLQTAPAPAPRSTAGRATRKAAARARPGPRAKKT
jgi:transcriptional regulator with XRE-family HTH domain